MDYHLDAVMCPSYKVSRQRVHSPKGRANIMREWLRQVTNKNYSLDLQLAVNKSDVIFIMNNNPKNIEFDINQLKDQRKRLIFDGWFMLDGQSIEKMPNLTYSTMGYVSKS